MERRDFIKRTSVAAGAVAQALNSDVSLLPKPLDWNGMRVLIVRP